MTTGWGDPVQQTEEHQEELGFFDHQHLERAEAIRQVELEDKIAKIKRYSLDPEKDLAKLFAEPLRELDGVDENDDKYDVSNVLRGGSDLMAQIEKTPHRRARARHTGLFTPATQEPGE